MAVRKPFVALWFLWCEDLTCDWLQHNKHSRHILGVHGNIISAVKKFTVFSYHTELESPCKMSAGDHKPLQVVMMLLHHQEECTLPLPNVQSGTDTCLEGTQLNMAVNSTATKIATLKLKKIDQSMSVLKYILTLIISIWHSGNNVHTLQVFEMFLHVSW